MAKLRKASLLCSTISLAVYWLTVPGAREGISKEALRLSITLVSVALKKGPNRSTGSALQLTVSWRAALPLEHGCLQSKVVPDATSVAFEDGQQVEGIPSGGRAACRGLPIPHQGD